MYELRPATDQDYDFMFGLLVASMREYVDRTWGWDDAYQQQRFRANFRPQEYQIILSDGKEVGAVSIDDRQTELFLSEIQILPSHQNRGFGTAIIEDLKARAADREIPVSLQVLKINPARRLYERLGFRHTGETETHFQMSCPCP